MSSETKEKDRAKLRIDRPVLKKWKGEISVEAYALLQKYQLFHAQVEKVKPSESELVNKGLLVAFQEDDAFQKFLRNGGGKPAGAEPVVSS